MTTVIPFDLFMLHDRAVGDAATKTWDAPSTVEGFVRSPPNQTLLHYAGRLRRSPDEPVRVLDIGCGAGRNAVALARAGFAVTGTDLSRPMLAAAARRDTHARINLIMAAMDALPVRDRSADLIIAHGIWNLARTDAEFRIALREAARAAAAHARLFVFTFSRHTLPDAARPVAGQQYAFTQFSGGPQTFLTADQLRDELHAAGFIADPELPLRELNLPPPGRLRIGGPPVIFEGGFCYHGA